MPSRLPVATGQDRTWTRAKLDASETCNDGVLVLLGLCDLFRFEVVRVPEGIVQYRSDKAGSLPTNQTEPGKANSDDSIGGFGRSATRFRLQLVVVDSRQLSQSCPTRRPKPSSLLNYPGPGPHFLSAVVSKPHREEEKRHEQQ